MTNRALPPPFIEEPPIYDDFLSEDGSINDSWTNWMNAVTRIMGYNIIHDYLIEPGGTNAGQRFDTNQFQVPQMIATQGAPNTELGRNELENARDGTIIYNKTTGRFNFREGGAWVTFTPVAA